ncbi:hypothetical protein JCM10212_000277 [Sporobolomyces blumeae]
MPWHDRSPRSTTLSDRDRVFLSALAACVVTFVLLSLSAHRNKLESPSAARAANYLPSFASSSSSSSQRLDRVPTSYDPRNPLAYRHELERTTSPPSWTTHSPTLTFSRIYVLSLPARVDRRTEMTRLANALGIELEFVDASDKHEPFFAWIAERVAEARTARRKVIAKVRKVPESTIGGIHIAGDWLTPYPSTTSHAPFPPFPVPASSTLRREFAKTGSSNWVEHLETLESRGGQHVALRPSRGDVNVTRLLWDPLERVAVRQLTPGVLSTYWGQTRAIKRMVERGDETALILEDDVDFEWDLERLWATIERRLPRGDEGQPAWDVTYLGHCWGGEAQKPQYLHPLLHPSTGPMCLHAYALTLAGAKRILSHLQDPWSAYSSAVDVAVPTLIHFDLIRSFSVFPPLVIQRKDGPSDLQKGNGSRWRGILRDSTHERVLRDRGEWHAGWEDRYDERNIDPATQLRCGPV